MEKTLLIENTQVKPIYTNTVYFVEIAGETRNGMAARRYFSTRHDSPFDAFSEAAHWAGDYEPRVLAVDYYSDGQTTERYLDMPAI